MNIPYNLIVNGLLLVNCMSRYSLVIYNLHLQCQSVCVKSQ